MPAPSALPPSRHRFLPWWLLAGVLLAFGALLAGLHIRELGERNERAEVRMSHQADLLAERIETRLQAAGRVAAAIATDVAQQPALLQATALQRYIWALPDIEAACVVDAHGKVLASTDPASVGRSMRMPHAQHAGESGFGLSSNPARAGYAVWHTLRLLDGKTARVILHFGPDSVEHLLHSARFAPDVWVGVTIIDRPGEIAESYAGPLQHGLRDSVLRPDAPTGFHSLHDPHSGERWFVASQAVQQAGLPPLKVVVARPKAEVLGTLQTSAAELLLLWLGVGLLGAVALWFFERRHRTDQQRASQTEARLSQAHTRLRLATEARRLGIWEFDATSGHATWDEATSAILGLRGIAAGNAAEVMQRFFHPDDLADAHKALTASVSEAVPIDHLFRIVRPDDGADRIVHFRSQMGLESGQSATQVIGTCEDVTDQHTTLTALHEARARFSSAFNFTSSGMALVGLDGRFMMANEALATITGYSVAELQQMTFHDLTHPDDADMHHPAIAAMREGEPKALLEKRYVRRNGSIVWVQVSIGTVRDDAGHVQYYVSQFQDVSLRHQAEAMLNQARIAAEQASQAKSRFLANMSHEIRTPLTAILGAAELLDNASLPAPLRPYLAPLRAATDRLTELVGDILDFSRIEAGRMELDVQAFVLPVALEEVRNILAVHAAGKGLTLQLETDARLPAHVRGDRMRLLQVLLNLGDNAIKFTAQGRVCIAVERLTDQGAQVLLRFSVTDSGIGIALDQLNAIFEPFTQADPSITRRFGGSGLGLALCRQLVELMGGRLHVESVPGQGSRFWFDLRLEAITALPSTAPAPSSPGARLTGRRILLVEDEALMRGVLVALLEREGASVQIAENAARALASLDDTSAPDTVVMDIHMPEVDGFTATRQLRAHPLGQRLHIVGLSADTLPDTRQAALAAGMDGLLSKPAHIDTLVAALLSDHASPPGTPTQPARFDLADTLARLGGDTALFKRSVARFSSTYADFVTQIEARLAAGAIAQADDALHRMTGLAGTLGAHALSRCAAETRRYLVDGNQQEIGPALLLLRQSMAETITELEAAAATLP